jgi:hypothetical protein
MDTTPVPDPHPPVEASALEEQSTTRWPKVIGMISLFYAAMGLLCQTGWGITSFFSEMLMSMGGMDIETPAIIKIFAIVMMVIMWFVGGLMLAGAIGLLRRRRAGVTRLRRWVVIRLVLLVLGTVAGIVMLPTSLEFQESIVEASNQAAREGGRPDMVQEFDQDAKWRQSIVMTAVFAGVFAAYPLFLGFYLSRSSIADEIQHWE